MRRFFAMLGFLALSACQPVTAPDNCEQDPESCKITVEPNGITVEPNG